MIRVMLPYPLQTLARVEAEVLLDVPAPVTPAAVIAALEGRHPVLHGTLRDPVTGERRPLLRFFVCGEDWSQMPGDQPLPEDVIAGREPFLVVAAIAGG